MLEAWVAINKKTHELLSYTSNEGSEVYIFDDSKELFEYMRLHKLRRGDYVVIAGEIIPSLRIKEHG